MHIRNIHAHPWALAVLMLIAATFAFAGTAAAQPDMSPSGLYETFVSGAGDPYTNVLLNQIFGPIFAVEGGGGITGETLFSGMVGYFNAAMLVIAGLMFFNNLAMGTIQSAHEGEVMGRNWSSLWAPLRTVFAVALLIPLPHMGGYNTAQVFIAFIAKNATNFASAAWSTTAEKIITGVVPVAAPRATLPQDLVSEVFMLEMCRVILNDQFRESASDPSLADRITRTPKQVTLENVLYDEMGMPIPVGSTHQYQTRVSYDRVNPDGEVITPALCGSYTTPRIPDVINNRVMADAVDSFSLVDVIDGSTASIRNAFQKLHSDVLGVPNTAGNVSSGLVYDMQAVAQTVYDAHKAREYNGGSDTAVPDITPSLIAALQKAEADLNTGYQDLMNRISANGTRNEDIRTAMINRISTTCSGVTDRACLGEGWIGAGSWYMLIARINNEIASLFAAEGTASASTSARSNANSTGWFFGWGRSEQEDRFMEQFDSAFAFGTRVFNNSANNMAAAGWPINPVLASNIAATLDGAEVDNELKGSGLKAKANGQVIALMQNLNDATFKQDPMIPIVTLGSGLVQFGSILIVADIWAPGNVASTIGGTIATAGATMSIIMPMMPFMFWIMAVTGYFLLVVEAFIAVNLWAISHLRMDGEGITGGVGREGWLMILALMTTPFLMVAGFLVGMIIFRISASLISSGFAIALSGLLGNGNPLFTLVASLVVALFMVIFYLVLIERSFSLIAEFPNRVLRWMGSQVNLGTDGADRVRAGALGAIGGTHTIANNATRNMQLPPPWRRFTNDGKVTGGSGPAPTTGSGVVRNTRAGGPPTTSNG